MFSLDTACFFASTSSVIYIYGFKVTTVTRGKHVKNE